MPRKWDGWNRRKSARGKELPASQDRSLTVAAQKRLFVGSRGYLGRAGVVALRLPPLAGRPIRLFEAAGLRDGGREVHAASFLRERSIGINCQRREFSRVLAHEVFHFVWRRLSNEQRWSYEDLLRRERRAHARGELGWSAEWRKIELTGADLKSRSRRWREYCCESFCDTGAWLYSGVGRHEEFTLAPRFSGRRRGWFAEMTAGGSLLI